MWKNNKVRQSCMHTTSLASTAGYAKTILLPLQCPGQMFSNNQLQRCGSCWCVFYCSPACQVATVLVCTLQSSPICCLPNSGKKCCREQTGPPDTGPCVRNMEQLQKLHWRLDGRKRCSDLPGIHSANAARCSKCRKNLHHG